MSNNYWNQQPNGNGSHPAENNGEYRAGSLLHDYNDQQRQMAHQYAPPTRPAPQGPPPYSPMPQNQPPQQQGQNWPTAQGWPSSPSFLNNAVQMVRHLSGKMTAARVGNVDQEPLVLYRPTVPPPLIITRSKPWKRSRAVRIAMQMRRR